MVLCKFSKCNYASSTCTCLIWNLKCLLGTLCPYCALATAKSSFDGSSCCFNCICFSNVLLVRHYIRRGYGIDGRIGISDCCMPIVCMPCVITQLLNEVDIQGPRLQSVESSKEYPWLAASRDYSCSGDPCDFVCSCMFCPCEIVTIYSQLTGAVSVVIYTVTSAYPNYANTLANTQPDDVCSPFGSEH